MLYYFSQRNERFIAARKDLSEIFIHINFESEKNW